MYYRHFGLSGAPFQFTPSANLLYPSKTHRECLAALEWSLMQEPSGFMLLLGETGTGKTTLLYATIARHSSNLRLAYVTNPRLSFEEILRVILPQFGEKTTGASRLELIQSFERALSRQPAGGRAAIVIDEAQHLNAEALEDLRLLTNCNRSQERQLGIALIGQPELLNHLAAPGMRQIRERIGAKARLTPLDPGESREYLDYRLHAKGAEARKIFAEDALDHLVRAGSGIPRRLNVLCHNAMLLAYSESKKRVTLRMAREVARDYKELFRPRRNPYARIYQQYVASRLGRFAGWALVLFVLGLGAGLLFASTDLGQYAIHAAATLLGSGYDPLQRASAIPASITISSVASSVIDDGLAHAESLATTLPAQPDEEKIAYDRLLESAPIPDAMVADEGTSDSNRDDAEKGTVRSGDTPIRLATEYLGSADLLYQLEEANPQIEDPSRIYPGQIVYLPAVEDAAD